VGHNFRLDELQAAVLRRKLPRLDAGNARRRVLAARYRARLADAGVDLPASREGSEAVHHVFPLRLPERDALQTHLEANGVGTGIHYKTPAHRQPALAAHPHRTGSMRVTDAAAAELLSIPMYPELSDTQLDYVVERIREFPERQRTTARAG
jgi:dTDP-4-amino-4,6-dideoxygalactose transaminase